LVAALVQFLGFTNFDADTAYHLAVARLTAAHGILHAFPWTPYSWLSDHYADKEFLFHLMMVPISSLRLDLVSKIVGTVLDCVILWEIYGILSAEGVDRAGIWTLLAVTVSGYFTMRLALVRPFLISIALTLGIVWASSRRRLLLLGALCVLYPLSYVAWHTSLVLVLLVELALFLSGQRPSWRTVATTISGLAVGILVHPNFPAIFLSFWEENVNVLVRSVWGHAEGLELGSENRPWSLQGYLRFALVPLLLATTALAVSFRRRRERPVDLAFALSAAAFAVLTLPTQRFTEYFVPFSTVAFALAIGRDAPGNLASIVVGSTALFTALFGRVPIEKLGTRGEDIPAPVAQVLREFVAPDAQVFTCGWGLTGELMLALPERRFMVALGPTNFLRKNPELYRLWYELVRTRSSHPARVVRDRFHARYILCEHLPEWAAFIQSVEADPEATPLLRGPLWHLAEVKPGQ
jgi:hypothetical protein